MMMMMTTTTTMIIPMSWLQRIRPIPRPCVIYHNKLIFYGEELLAPRPAPAQLANYELIV